MLIESDRSAWVSSDACWTDWLNWSTATCTPSDEKLELLDEEESELPPPQPNRPKKKPPPEPPELPDFEYTNKKWNQVPKDKYPYWVGLGVVYELVSCSLSESSDPETRAECTVERNCMKVV